MRALREQIARVAQHDAHTLFTGEAGSGRELFARYLASQSEQSRAPVRDRDGRRLERRMTRSAQLLGDGTEPGALERAEDGVLFIKELGDVSPAGQRILLERPRAGRVSRPRHKASTSPLNVPDSLQRVPGVRAQRDACVASCCRT